MLGKANCALVYHAEADINGHHFGFISVLTEVPHHQASPSATLGPRLPTNVPVAVMHPWDSQPAMSGTYPTHSVPAETVHGGNLWPAGSGNNHTLQHSCSSQPHHNKKMHAAYIGNAPEASDSGGQRGVCCWIPESNSYLWPLHQDWEIKQTYLKKEEKKKKHEFGNMRTHMNIWIFSKWKNKAKP